MSSVAVATLARETPPGPDPYRRTLAQLSSAGAPLASRGAGLDPLHVLAAVALLAGATAVLRHGRVAVDARHAAAPAVPQLPPVALGRPALATVSPARQAVRLRVGETREFSVEATGDELHYRWTVDDAPAGKQESLTLHPMEPGTIVVRAVVASNLGAATTRQWRINVVPTSTPAPAAAPGAAPPAGVSPPKPAASTPEHEPQASVAPASPGPDEQGVRSFLDGYAAAWRAHDVDALRRLGQVTSDEQARTLREYFAKVQDLDVEVHLVEVRADGERTVVRFTRRDRFRDPLGRVISKESPPIERSLVSTPEGFRFATPGG